MLDYVLPWALADVVRNAILTLPLEFRSVVFVVLLGLYIYIVVYGASRVVLYLDYVIACMLRFIRLRPPSVQFWCGAVAVRAPRVTGVVVVLVAVLTVVQVLIDLKLAPVRGTPLDQIQTYWRAFIGLLWRLPRAG